MGIYLQNLLQIEGDPVENELRLVKQRVTENLDSSRRLTYKLLNPELVVPDIYRKSNFVPEHHRIAYTRIRLGSHRFRIETGRWSRIPRERRLCNCGHIQDEDHVLLKCTLLSDIRMRFASLNYMTLESLMNSEDFASLSHYLYVIMKKVNEINEQR